MSDYCRFGNLVRLIACFVAAIGMAIGSAESASANAWEYVGFNGRSIAMGGAMIGGAEGAASAFYNPAGLIRGKKRGGELTFMAGIPLLSLDTKENKELTALAERDKLSEDSCAAVDEKNQADCVRTINKHNRYIGSAKEHLAFNKRLIDQAINPKTLYGVTLGGVLPLAYDPKDAFIAVGGAAFIPIGPVAYQRIKSPTVPYFLRYDDGPHRIVINAGASAELPYGIRLGAGAGFLVDISAFAEANIFIPPELLVLPEPNIQDIRFVAQGTVQLPISIFPVAGLQYEPAPWINIGISYRHKQEVNIELDGELAVYSGRDTVDKIPLSIATSGVFTPTSVGGGVSLIPIDGLTINVDATWKQWSKYNPPFSIDLQIAGLQEAACSVVDSVDQLPGLLDALPDEFRGILENDDGDLDLCQLIQDTLPAEVETNTYSTNTKIKDVVEIATGVEYIIDDSYIVSGGYRFQPTPIPDQTGIYNILDADTHVLSGRFAVNWQGVNIGLFGQYSLLASRKVKKVSSGATSSQDQLAAVDQDVSNDATFSYSDANIAESLTAIEELSADARYANALYPEYTIGGGFLTVGLEVSMDF